MLDVRTHTDGGQTAEAVAERVAAWLGAARRTLDLALYDVRLPDAVGDRVAGGAGKNGRSSPSGGFSSWLNAIRTCTPRAAASLIAPPTRSPTAPGSRTS